MVLCRSCLARLRAKKGTSRMNYFRYSWVREIVVITFICFFFMMFLFSQVKGLSLRIDNDYDSNIPIYTYVVEVIHEKGYLPLTHPYVGPGISVHGDPLSAVFHPLVMIPLIIFGIDVGFKVILFLLPWVSALAMLLVLRTMITSSVARVFGSLLYGFSGALIARIAAGHIEKFISYAFLPLVFIFLLKPKFVSRDVLPFSLLISLTIFSGDIYAVWFIFLILIITRMYFIAARMTSVKREVGLGLLSALLVGVFTAVRTIPFLLYVYPHMVRFFPIHPLQGSLHIFVSPLLYIVPFTSGFYDRPSMQRIFGFGYNWTEYFSFLSPFALFLLAPLGRIWKRPQVRILCYILVLLFLFVAIAFPYSPFYWAEKIIPVIRIFRAPSRSMLVSMPVIISLVALSSSVLLVSSKGVKRIAHVSMIVSIVWVMAVYGKIFVSLFELPRIQDMKIVQELKAKDASTFSVGVFACCFQKFLVESHIPIVNYYYGWRMDSQPDFLTADGNKTNVSRLYSVRPQYVIGDKKDSFGQYGYTKFLDNDRVSIWRAKEHRQAL